MNQALQIGPLSRSQATLSQRLAELRPH
jgi:hypothetical protein